MRAAGTLDRSLGSSVSKGGLIGVVLAAFWVADRALAASAGALGLSGSADIAGLPLLGLVTMAVSLVALPGINGWSRRLETRADDFALSLTRAPGPFIGVM